MQPVDVISHMQRGSLIFERLLRGPICSHQKTDLQEAQDDYRERLMDGIPASPSDNLQAFMQHFITEFEEARIGKVCAASF
jgi:hypothetical protein